ncbi:MAG TPA: hypothetical protein VJ835_05415 [Fimbriimonadaceae bacterium]|nr:hypothetical protein [Fimbriimonadaceae bacterium]
MNKFLQTAGLVLILVSISSFASAQAAGPQGGGLQNGQQNNPQVGKRGQNLRQMQKLEKDIWAKLDPPLSKTQKADIAKVDKDTLAAYKALRAKAQTDDRKALQTEIQKIQTKRREAIKGILDDRQEQSYTTLLKEAMKQIQTDRAPGKKGKGKNKNGIG